MSLRILHVTPYFTDAWAYGGIPRLATTLTTGLARRGHHVTVCTTDVCDRHSRLPGPSPRSGTLGHRCSRLPKLVEPAGLRVAALHAHRPGAVPCGAGAQFDIAHIHGHRHLLERVAARWCRIHGVPYVSAPNGTAPRIERRKALKRVWDAMWGRRDLAGAAAVRGGQPGRACAAAGDGGRARSKSGSSPTRWTWTSGLRRPARGGFRRQHDLGDAPLVVFLGKITPRKRLDVVMAAMPRVQMRAARLVVAGNDMGSGPAARQLASTLGIAERTQFVGLLTGRARLDLLADADVVVYPSADEVFGLVPLEALLCGTPVVVADDSGCGEIVGAARRRARSWPWAMPERWPRRSIACWPRRRPGARGPRRGAAAVAERFGGPVVAEQVDALYREVLAR